jgi:hypothetical protein
MKFKPGDHVIVHRYLTDNRAGRHGVIVQIWPKIESPPGKSQFQYGVALDGDKAYLIFNEDQLELDVLDRLARL